MTFKYKLRTVPAFTDRDGTEYAGRVDVVKICSRGLRWDGGEFSCRADAVRAAEASGLIPA